MMQITKDKPIKDEEYMQRILDDLFDEETHRLDEKYIELMIRVVKLVENPMISRYREYNRDLFLSFCMMMTQ